MVIVRRSNTSRPSAGVPDPTLLVSGPHRSGVMMIVAVFRERRQYHRLIVTVGSDGRQIDVLRAR